MNPKTKLFLLHVAAAFIGTILALVVFTLVMKQFEKKTEVPPKKKKPDVKRDVVPDEKEEYERDSPGDSPGEDETDSDTDNRSPSPLSVWDREQMTKEFASAGKGKSSKPSSKSADIEWHDSRNM